MILKRDLVIGSRLSDMNEVRNFLDEIFYESDLDRRYFNRVFLGLSEAVNNSMRHGNEFDESKSVYITAKCEPNSIVFEVGDEGKGFDFNGVADPRLDENIKKVSGRGLFLIRHVADDLEFLNGGRKVRIKYWFENEC